MGNSFDGDTPETQRAAAIARDLLRGQLQGEVAGNAAVIRATDAVEGDRELTAIVLDRTAAIAAAFCSILAEQLGVSTREVEATLLPDSD